MCFMNVLFNIERNDSRLSVVLIKAGIPLVCDIIKIWTRFEYKIIGFGTQLGQFKKPFFS